MTTGNIYLIELSSPLERFYKIGITVHRFCRFYEIMKSGYECRIVYMVLGIEYSYALGLEGTLQSLFEPYTPMKKFGGHRECFSDVNIEMFKDGFIDVDHKEVVEDLSISWRPDLNRTHNG